MKPIARAHQEGYNLLFYVSIRVKHLSSSFILFIKASGIPRPQGTTLRLLSASEEFAVVEKEVASLSGLAAFLHSSPRAGNSLKGI